MKRLFFGDYSPRDWKLVKWTANDGAFTTQYLDQNVDHIRNVVGQVYIYKRDLAEFATPPFIAAVQLEVIGTDTDSPYKGAGYSVIFQVGEYTAKIGLIQKDINDTNILYVAAHNPTRGDQTTYNVVGGAFENLISFGSRNEKLWVGLKFETDNTVSVVYYDSPDATLEQFLDNYSKTTTGMAWDSGNSQVEIITILTDHDALYAPNPSKPVVGSLYQIYIEGIGNIGGDASISDTLSSNSITALSGGGQAKIKVEVDPNSFSLSDFEANYRKSVTIYSDDGVLRFKGEIDDFDYEYDKVTYFAPQDLRKLNDMKCNINPVVKSSYIQLTEGNVVYDYFAEWVVNAYTGKLLVVEDRDAFDLRVSPDISLVPHYFEVAYPALLTEIAIANDTSGGASAYLHFDDRTATENTSWLHALAFEGQGIAISYEMDFYKKENTVWKDVKLQMNVRFNSLAGAYVDGIGAVQEINRPELLIWNYTTASWNYLYDLNQANGFSISNVDDDETWHDPTLEALSHTGGMSPVFSINIDILKELGITDIDEHYTSAIVTVNEAGFVDQTIKIGVRGIVGATPLTTRAIEIHFLNIDFIQDRDNAILQTPLYGVGLIASNTATSLTLTNSLSWAINDFPQTEGFNRGDKYYITDQIDDVLDAIFALQAKWTINHNITVDGVGETEDLTDTKIMQVLQKYKAIVKGTIYSESTEIANVVALNESADSVGIVITSADIVDYKKGGFKYSGSSKNVKETITGIGSNDRVGEQAISPSIGNSLGGEDVIYRDNELGFAKAVQDFVDSKAALHTSPIERCEFKLCMHNPTQMYTDLAEGKKMDIQLPTVANAQIDLTGANALTIDNLVMFSNDNGEQYIIVTMERRY